MAVERLPGLPSRYGATPAEVWQGDALDVLLGSAAELGWTRVWLVTDAGVRLTGWPDRLGQALVDAGLSVSVFDDVWPDPTSDHVARCAELAERFAPDGLLAIGGGSALDTAKGCAFLLANGGRMEDWWGAGAATEPLLPLIAVPTTAGTGSEVQSFALIARAADRVKMACGAPTAMPRVALLDARLTASAPAVVTAQAGMDALVHALETAVTTARTPASEARAIEAFALLAEHLPVVLARPDDLGARAAMQRGACWAGQAIEASMLGAAHAAANPLSARHHVPHGVAVGLMAPHVIRFNAADPEAAATYGRLAEAAGAAAEPEALARWVATTLAATGLEGSLAAWGVDDPTALAADAATQWTGRFNPRTVDEGGFRSLYAAAAGA